MDNNAIDIKIYINHLIDKEIDKPLEEQDIDLINEYTAYLDELDDNKIDTSSDAYLKIKSDNIQKLLKYENKFNNTQNKRFNFTWKRILVAAIVISLLTAGTVTIANRYNLFEQIGSALFDFPVNEVVKVDGQDVVFLGETREYNTIEEFMKGESIESLLYPTYVPEGVTFNNISGSGQTGFLSFTLNYIDDNTSEQTTNFTFWINEKPEFNEEEYFAGDTVYEHNGINFYILNIENSNNYIQFYYDNFFYSIYSSDSSIIYEIIEGIEVITIK
jgi:hypothetical protein